MDPQLLAISTVAEKLAELFKKLRGERVRRNTEVARYLDDLSASMGRVLDSLKDRKIPRVEGHEMAALIHAFPDKTKGVLDTGASAVLQKALSEVGEIAKTLDIHYVVHQPEVETHRRQMIEQVERIVGDCRGMAKVLKQGV